MTEITPTRPSTTEGETSVTTSGNQSESDSNPPPEAIENSPSLTSDMSELHTKDTITVVLAGKSGAGKSTLVKNVFGGNTDTKMCARARTKSLKKYSVESNGKTLTIIDTVGFTRDNRKKQLKEISKFTKGQADLLLYCLPVGPGSRFEDRNPEIMRSLQDAFGKGIWQHCMVVLTFSNLAWDRISTSNPDQETAADQYKEYIQEYVEEFQKELRNLKVENTKVQSFLNQELIPTSSEEPSGNPLPAGNREPSESPQSVITFLPAGYKRDDPVLPGVQYRRAMEFTTQPPDATASATPPQAQDITEVTTDKWAAVLVCLILQKCTPECSMALLQFWYGRKRIGAALKQTGVPLALGTGSVAGGAVGGAVGAVVGAVAGPIGVPIVATFGFGLGLVIGSVIGGGGAAVVTGAAGHALDEGSTQKAEDKK